ncbi:hypothetical protein [Roseateles depolymerans]|uniref:Uncharacterized protein n=2 Tax=Roseateles depolymerans TaxID=76731 RepID=A0A0U3D3N2_9BURK|nr:hypothetical protein [Roseateles depolymerans]ALV08214.1 hypothetical protein RD2015_3762 [Roseateles depolymerans]REG21561.1 hypothetical protein DES44_0682 [Roseateles depolymerans]
MWPSASPRLAFPPSPLPLSPLSPQTQISPQLQPSPQTQPSPLSPLAPLNPASPASPVAASPLITETLALATLLREGGWNTALERVAPQLLARLPPSHPLRLGKVAIRLDHGQVLEFGGEEAGKPARQIRWAAEFAEAEVSPAPESDDFHYLVGPHAYLAALLGKPFEDTAAAQRARHLLADLIERHTEVAALSLAIFKRWPDRDPEVMLRFCLHGDQWRPAGRQLLNASPGLRDMTAVEIAHWQAPAALLQLTQEWMEQEGLCIADARWHLSPMGVSSHGLKALKQARLGVLVMNSAQQTSAWEALAQAFPELRYELGSLYALAAFLRQRPDMVSRKVPTDRHLAGLAYREALKAASVLEAPELSRDRAGT